MPDRRSPPRTRQDALATSIEDVEHTVDTFIDKFAPALAALIRDCRSELRRQLPGAFELVYDNYNFFVIGFCPTKQPADCIVSLAASANGVALSFYRGVDISDPDGLLQGDGKQNRFVRLADAEALRVPAVRTLILKAAGLGPPLAQGPGVTIVRSVSAKQRPRRRGTTDAQ